MVLQRSLASRSFRSSTIPGLQEKQKMTPLAASDPEPAGFVSVPNRPEGRLSQKRTRGYYLHHHQPTAPTPPTSSSIGARASDGRVFGYLQTFVPAGGLPLEAIPRSAMITGLGDRLDLLLLCQLEMIHVQVLTCRFLASPQPTRTRASFQGAHGPAVGDNYTLRGFILQVNWH